MKQNTIENKHVGILYYDYAIIWHSLRRLENGLSHIKTCMSGIIFVAIIAVTEPIDRPHNDI
jgi:hypothetical protein